MQDSIYLSTEEYPTRTAALAGLDTFVRQINSGLPPSLLGPQTFGELLDEFVRSERLQEIKNLRPGETHMSREDLSFTTACSYLSVIKRIRARWGETPIAQVKPHAVGEWLKQLVAAPKTKGNIKALMHRLAAPSLKGTALPRLMLPVQLHVTSVMVAGSARDYFCEMPFRFV